MVSVVPVSPPAFLWGFAFMALQKSSNDGGHLKREDSTVWTLDAFGTSVMAVLIVSSTGFTYTEIVPQNFTPLPDDNSSSMSLASRYGGMIPRSQLVAPNALIVCVKTTRYILKKLVFVSPALKVDTTLP